MYDVYLYLNETAHGKRFWLLHKDSVVGRLLPPDRTLKVLGPSTVGDGGYTNEIEAAKALAESAGIDLSNPAEWEFE